MKSTLSLVSACVALTCSAHVAADHLMEETVVLERHDTRVIDVIESLSVAPDPARLLYKSPGANVTTNGPLTGIPQLRGLFGPRIAVTLDNTLIAPAGPNWMDPPLSYAVTAQLESLTVYRGIAPVSLAQESLGGLITATTYRKPFTNSDSFEFEGRVQGSAQTATSGYQWDLTLQGANKHHRVKFAAMGQAGEDGRFPGGDITPSSYERERYDLGYGFTSGRHSFQLDVGHTDTGESGTPALPMDIDYFRGNLVDATYRFALTDTAVLSASLFGSDLDHGMTNYHMRQPPGAGSRWRQNIATTENRGFRVQLDLTLEDSVLRAGVDGFQDTHDSNIDNPNNPQFFVVNFNSAERSLVGAYVEQDITLSDQVRGEWGVRVNAAETNAGEVNGTPAMMMPPAQALRDAFNGADRQVSDTLVDAFGKLTWGVFEDAELYLGLAHKQRAPSYQERYLWLPLEATAGLADGNVYLGDINLSPETAYQAELGLNYATSHFQMQPRLFYQRIDDFIQGTPLNEGTPGVNFVRMMNRMNGTNRADPLQFSNVDAQLYGFDMDWSWQWDAHWRLSGIVNVVRGERRDIDDDLYRIAPPNASLAVTHQRERWALTAETIAYGHQSSVSETNREQTTAGYAVVNLAATWQARDNIDLAVGVDNVFDRAYTPHLGGYNRAANPDVPMMNRLPALGLNAFARINYTF